jgi:DNA-binding XRE family transcriptional regulator
MAYLALSGFGPVFDLGEQRRLDPHAPKLEMSQNLPDPYAGMIDIAVDVINMITPRQIRAARALLGWSQQRLADKTIVSLNALARLEKGGVDSRVSTVLPIQKALAKAGVEFLDADQKGEGVRLRSPRA